jgi:predicted GIY-YIG superfamily endonuclease
MKKYYVYEIVNLMGTIEYVGETATPKRRWHDHHKPSGRFGNRSDVFMSIVCEFDNRKEAFNYQCELQEQYGFETDFNKLKRKQRLTGKMLADLKSTPIIAFDKNTNYINEFVSLQSAARELNLHASNICKVLKQKIKSTGGYTFEYKVVK